MRTLPVPTSIRQKPLVTVCASFNRFLKETGEAIEELQDRGAIVLSPQKAKPHSLLEGEFLLLEGDLKFAHGAIKQVEDRHLESITRSDFVWIVCPGGYIGNSVAMEIGYAIGRSVPVYAVTAPIIHGRVLERVHVVENIGIAVLNHSVPVA